MRLINTSSYKVHKFIDAKVLPYAILSHRWDNEKPTFQEWTRIHDQEEVAKPSDRGKINRLEAKSGY
jgi:hypothetical protein